MPHARTTRSLWGFGLAVPAAAPIALVLFASFAQAAPSASASSDTLDLPDARARASAPAAPAAGVHRLEGESLRRFASLEQALDALPGFRVRRQGGLGGYSALSFRGARANQIEVYVDGIRLDSDGAGAPDLAGWPLLWFSSLEARTGFDPSGASPGSIARLDLSTRSAAPAEAHLRAGSFSTTEAALSLRAAGPWTWTVSAQGQGSRNDYPWFSDNGTIYNTEDDETLRMENNAYWSRGLRGSARREDGASSRTFSAVWIDSRKEYPGLFPSTARAYGRREEWLGAWREENAQGPVRWEAGVQGRFYRDAYRDPAQTLGYLSEESAREARSLEADARARRRLEFSGTGFLDLGLDARLRGESIEPTVTPFSQPRSSPEARRGEAQAGATLGAGAGGLSAVLEGRAALARFAADGILPAPDTGAGRLVTLDRAVGAARAAAQWKAGPQALGAVARLERRMPSSGELLGDNLGVRPHLDLDAEETRALSLLYSFSLSGAAARATLFRNEYRNPIRLAAHGASAFLRFENGADYTARGAELSGEARARFAEASASFTAQELAIEEGLYRGNRPAYQSPIEAHGELFLKPLKGARLGPVVDYRAAYYPGDANLRDSRRAAEWEWSAHASARRGGASLAFDARNLADRQYNDFRYTPRSGRNYSLTFSLTL